MVRKRASTLAVDKGEVLLKRKARPVESCDCYSSHTSTQINHCCSLKNISANSIPAAPGKQPPPNPKAKTLAFKRRQQKTTHQEQATAAITVEDCNFPSEKCEEQWVSGLTERDRAVLTENDWVTDNIIDAAQGLLKKQFVHINGLQSVVLGLTLSYAIQKEEFIQVLHTGRGHWVMVSTTACTEGEINIFDSYPPALTSHLMNQIAALLATPNAIINVKYMDAWIQCGSADCGIYAIAFATTLASGEKPGGLLF